MGGEELWLPFGRAKNATLQVDSRRIHCLEQQHNPLLAMSQCCRVAMWPCYSDLLSQVIVIKRLVFSE